MSTDFSKNNELREEVSTANATMSHGKDCIKALVCKTVLITGASSGIGLEFARIFAREGYHLVLVARREERLIQLKKELEQKHSIQVTYFICDLTVFDAADRMYQFLQYKKIQIDVLVNNAGFGLGGEFSGADLVRVTEMVQVNVTTLMRLTRLLLPDMIERREGKILNVASMAGFLPGPLSSVYYATKSFVISFSEALAYELKDNNVQVTVLCPGPVKTEFQNIAYEEDISLTNQRRIPTAQETAEYGYQALMAGKIIAIPNLYNRFILFLIRFLPRSMIVRLVYSKQATHRATYIKESA